MVLQAQVWIPSSPGLTFWKTCPCHVTLPQPFTQSCCEDLPVFPVFPQIWQPGISQKYILIRPGPCRLLVPWSWCTSSWWNIWMCVKLSVLSSKHSAPSVTQHVCVCVCVVAQAPASKIRHSVTNYLWICAFAFQRRPAVWWHRLQLRGGEHKRRRTGKVYLAPHDGML